MTPSRRLILSATAAIAAGVPALSRPVTAQTTPAPAHTGTLAVDGAAIWYSVRGADAAPAVVMLHGGLGHSGWMQSVSDALAPSHRVIAIDTRGMGRSSLGPTPLTYARQERDALAVLAHLGVTRYSLIGFSDGGIVGYRLAARPDSGLSRLVTMGSRWSAENGRGMWSTFDGWNAQSLSQGPFAFIVSDYNGMNPDRQFDRMIAQAIAMWKDGSENGHPEAAIARIAQPVLVIVGDRDPFLSVEDAAAARGRIPNAELMVVPGGTHPAHNERPDLVMPAIARFLNPPRT